MGICMLKLMYDPFLKLQWSVEILTPRKLLLEKFNQNASVYLPGIDNLKKRGWKGDG